MNPIKSFLHQSQRTFILASALLLPIGFTATAGVILPDSGPAYSEAELNSIQPTSANPYLSSLADDTTPDFDYWDSVGHWKRANGFIETTYPFNEGPLIFEKEPNSLNSNPQRIYELIDFSPTGAANRLFISGEFSTYDFVYTTVTEENGSINDPVHTNLTAGQVTSVDSYIGDGVHGSGGTQAGDFDFYETAVLPKNALLQISIDTLANETLIPYITLWSRSGELLYAQDDFDGSNPGVLTFKAEEAGRYYICVGGFSFLGNGFPRDPFVAGSGTGAASEGYYSLTIAISDLDIYEFEFEAGDVVGFSNGDTDTVQVMTLEKAGDNVVDPNDRIVPFDTTLLSTQANKLSPQYSVLHPMITDDNVHGALTIPETGTYRLIVSGTKIAEYEIDIRVLRSSREDLGIPLRVYVKLGAGWYLDGNELKQYALGGFNPQIFDPSIFEDSVKIGSLWGKMEQMDLSGSMKWEKFNDPPDYIRLVDNLIHELEFLMPGVDFILEDTGFALVGEDDDPLDPDDIPPFPDTSNSMKIYLMGTTFEVKIDAIGIHETVDPGNMILFERGMVTSDRVIPEILEIPRFLEIVLGGELTAREAKTKIFGRYFGRLVVKEVGIMVGALETNPANEVHSVMDSGLNKYAGLGDDLQFDSFDDEAVRLFPDDISFFYGYVGTQYSNESVYWGAALGANPLTNLDELYVNYNSAENGVGTEVEPFNVAADAVAVVNPGGTINIAPGTGSEVFTGGDTIDTPMTLKKSDGAGVVRIGE